MRRKWHKRRWEIREGATGCCTKVVAAKRIKRTKRKMRTNWKTVLWKWAVEYCCG